MMKTVVRSFSIILIVTILLAQFGLKPAAADSNFTVNSNLDLVDVNPGNGVCETDMPGQCTLRAAIQEANALPGADSITLPALPVEQSYTLSLTGTGEDAAASGDLDITGSLEIIGEGAGTTIVDANDIERVFHVLAGGSLTARGITIRNGNLSHGAGVLVEGTFVLEDSVIADNIGSSGGGVFSTGSTTIRRSLVFNNSAAANDGGGLFASAGAMVVENSTVANNNAVSYGGGLVTTAGAGTPQVTIRNSTFAGNSAPNGAGIFFWSGTMSVQNTIVANNTSGANCGGFQLINSLGNNLSSDSSCDFTASGDHLSTNPILGPLTDNGGPTRTMALQPGSPAIDAGNADACPATDQRGVTRPQGGGCDIGAFEAQSINVFTVTNTSNSGAGSLRQAILDANSTANLATGADEIHFNISGSGVQTISPTSGLPLITEAVIIDGYTQPGASPNTLAVGNNAVLKIELNGTSAGNSDGLGLRTSNSIIRGLVVNRFAGAGVSVSEINNKVAGNFIGTDPSGSFERGNGADGVFVANYFQPVSANNNTIGGSTPADRNLISANGNRVVGGPRNGITLDQVANTLIYGNYIGTNAAGTTRLGNYQSGIGVFRGSGNVIGGSSPGQGNLISGNVQDGIGMGDLSQVGGHVVKGNLIGTNAQGNPTLGNGRYGILLNTPNVTVGGTNPGEGNTIADNGSAGINLGSGVGNPFRGNAIYANDSLGIDLANNVPATDPVTFNHAGTASGPNNYQNYPVLTLATSNGSTTRVVGKLDSQAGQTYTIDVFANDSCDPSFFGEGKTYRGSFSVTTNAQGLATFDQTIAGGLNEPVGLTTTATGTSGTSEFSYCRPISTPNLNWVQAQTVSSGSQTQQFITDLFQEKWFKIPVQPGATITVKLTSLPGSAVSLHRDPLPIYNGLLNPQNAAVLSAEAANTAFLPSGFLPSGFLPSGFLPSGFLPSGFLPSGFLPSGFLPYGSLPSGFLPSGFLPSGFLPSSSLPSGFLPSGFLPSGFLPSGFLPSGFLAADSLPSGFLPSGFLPSGFLGDAYAGAAWRSLLGISMDPYATVQTIERNTYDLNEDLYIRVVGPYNLQTPFTLEVSVSGGVCGNVEPIPGTIALSPASGTHKTLILTDSSRLKGTATEINTALANLQTLAGRPDVDGVVINLADTAFQRVRAANIQADANLPCAAAKNIVAAEIKKVIEAYRTANPTLQYIVLAGSADVIPFFQVQDVAGLANEKDYVVPVAPSTASEAGLKTNLVQGQDAYGSQVTIAQAGHTLALPDLAVGRLVDTASDISTAVTAYIQTGGVINPTSSLVTGYDFVGDAAVAVKAELDAGTNSTADTLIQAPGLPPSDPSAWTANQLRTKLLAANFDIAMLSGHFSAGNLLAADYTTQLTAAEIAQSTADLTDVLVLALGCHGGYSIPTNDLLQNVSPEPDWAKAFLRKKAAGYVSATGYAYGDTELKEYGERLFILMAQQLRTGTGPIAVGQALVKAKQQYLAETAQLSGLDHKTLVEMTLYGLPMMKVDMPGARLTPPSEPSRVGGTAPVTGGPGQGFSLSSAVVPLNSSDLATTTHTKVLGDLSTSDLSDTVTTFYLSGKDEVVANPFEPIYPKAIFNVSATNVVLRGVALRGGSYTDITEIDGKPFIPLTTSPATETSSAHLSYNTDVFYPVQAWAPNYFDAVDGGNTRLITFPAQFKSSGPSAVNGTLRKFSSLNLQLYYLPSNWADQNSPADTKAAAVGAAPNIQGVSAIMDGSTMKFSANVTAEGSAGVQKVWVLYTGKASPYHGSWTAVDLTRNSEDPTIWEGSFQPNGNAEDILFMVQAVGGAGLTSLATNLGAYYSLEAGNAPEPVATTLELQSPPTSGTYLKQSTFNVLLQAVLQAGVQPLPNQLVSLDIGGQQVSGITNASGQATLSLTPVIRPGSYTAQARFRGNADYLGSNDTSAFTLNKDSTTLTVTPNSATVLTTQPTPFVAVVRDSSGRALGGKSVFFVIHNSTNTFATSVIADFQGKAALGAVTLPAGIYIVDAYFNGTIPLNPSITLSDDYYQSSSRLGLSLELKSFTFTGFFSPVDNPPILNQMNAGRAVPLKFSLGGNQGLAIFAAGYPKSQVIPCSSQTPVDSVEETVDAGASSLSFDPASGRYTYTWKTERSWANTCRQVILKFIDGQTFTANFKFVR